MLGSGLTANRRLRTALLVVLGFVFICAFALLSPRRGELPLWSASASVAPTADKPKTWMSDLTPPLSKQMLGRATWSFFHTTAGHYPEYPTPDQEAAAVQLFNSAAVLYPCETCAEHFRAYLVEHPVRAGTRSELTLWLCEFHNAVNERLGKPIFNCAIRQDYWDDKPLEDCGCSGPSPPDEVQPGRSY